MLWGRGDGQDARKQLWRSKIGVSAGMIGGVVNGQLRRKGVFLIIADSCFWRRQKSPGIIQAKYSSISAYKRV